MAAVAPARPFADSVFVNCPFDAAFLPLLHALVFTIHDCGYFARIATEQPIGTELRLDKIVRLIRESRLSIHDLSRVPSSPAELPRFNMPFECGLAYGAIRYARNRKGQPLRGMLFMTAEAHQDKKTLSDLSGLDARAHEGKPERLIATVRTFLQEQSTPGAQFRSSRNIHGRLQAFADDLATLARRGDFDLSELTSFDQLVPWTYSATEWIRGNAKR